jgi:hypothetical protein
MKSMGIMRIFLAWALLGSLAQGAFAIDEIPEKYMYDKGGVLYPHTGDSSQQRFQTPANARQMFAPDTLIGVLPQDCVPASKGAIGEYYKCDHDFALKAEDFNGKTVYRVIDAK